MMSQQSDELLYSLIISQLKDDGFYEEADSLQRRVVSTTSTDCFVQCNSVVQLKVSKYVMPATRGQLLLH